VKIRGFAKKVWEGDGESVGFIRVFLKKKLESWTSRHSLAGARV
jgi:hypothetical protein